MRVAGILNTFVHSINTFHYHVLTRAIKVVQVLFLQFHQYVVVIDLSLFFYIYRLDNANRGVQLRAPHYTWAPLHQSIQFSTQRATDASGRRDAQQRAGNIIKHFSKTFTRPTEPSSVYIVIFSVSAAMIICLGRIGIVTNAPGIPTAFIEYIYPFFPITQRLFTLIGHSDIRNRMFNNQIQSVY